MQYEVVFDVAEVGYQQWKFPAVGLIMVMIGLGLLAYMRQQAAVRQPAFRRWFPYCFTGFSVLWVVLAFIGTFADYWRLREAVRTGQFELVEGVVTDFTPMVLREGQKTESFFVDGRRFEYSDYLVTAGFNRTRSQGGPIREGLRVRIANVGGKIARLEIARSR